MTLGTSIDLLAPVGGRVTVAGPRFRHAHTDEDPQWTISKERFESELALYERDLAEHRI